MAEHNQPLPPRPRRTVADYHDRLDRGCRRTFLGGIHVWRTIKRLSQLLVISFGFWMGVTGSVDPTLAFVGMLGAYLGTEGLENLLVALGTASDVTIQTGTDEGEERDAETDGGRVTSRRIDER